MAKKKQDLTPEERLAAALVPEEEWPYALPDGWKWVYWGKCGDFIAGTGFPQLYQGIIGEKYPFYKVGSLRSIDADGYLMDNQHSIDDKILLKIKAKKIEPNSIVFAKIGEAIKLNRRGLTKQVCCVDNNMMAFQADKNLLDYHYVYYWSTGIDLYKYTNATTVPAIRKTDLEKIVFPLPPLSEQHRLVARIESLFAKLDAAREKVQSVLNSHETRKAALLHDAFTGKLTAKWREEQGISLVNWQTRSLSDCGTWKGGGTPSKAHPDYWENGEIMWVTSKDMKSDKIQDTQMHITPLGVEQSSAIYSEKPAVLFVTRSGILRHTLPVALVNRPFTTNQDLKSLTPNENIDTQYLFFAAKAFSGQILKTCMKNGTTVESINTKKLMEFLLPIASMREQKVIAKMLRQLLNKEQRARQAAEETLTAIDRMKQSILARAFRGEL